MQLKVSPLHKTNIITIDSKKNYIYTRTDKSVFIVKPELRQYEDGEGYHDDFHYGWIFTLVRIVKYNVFLRIGHNMGTLPDLCSEVKEWNGE